MKRILILTILLMSSLAWAGSTTVVVGQVSSGAGGGDSALYTAATAIWDFENNANDTKGTYNLTANNSPTYSSVDYKQGSYAASLDDASSQYFSHADNDAFDIGTGTDWSISFWIKCDDVANGLHLMGKVTYGDGYRFTSHYSSGYGVAVWFYDGYGYETAKTTVINNDTWYHYVISHDVSEDNELTVWISAGTFGSVENAGAYNMDTDPDVNASALTVGAYNSTNTFSGLIDEVIFFKGTALNATQAEAIYNGNWR